MRLVDSHGHETAEQPDRHERQDAGTRGVWWFLIALLVFVALSVAAMAGLYWLFGSAPAAGSADVSPLAPARQVPPTPRLQTHPNFDMDAFRRREEQILNSYGIADRATGAVRIPIDRAIDIVAQRGLPARAPGQPQPPAAPATGPESGIRQAAPAPEGSKPQ